MLHVRLLSGISSCPVTVTVEVFAVPACSHPALHDHFLVCREIKERIKKTKDEKKAKKAETVAKSQKTQSKGNMPKGAAPKGPKLGGGGGKR